VVPDTNCMQQLILPGQSAFRVGLCIKASSLSPTLVQRQCSSPILVFFLQRTSVSQSLLLFLPATLGRSKSYVLYCNSTLLSCPDDLQIISCSLNPRLDIFRQCCSHSPCPSVPPRPHCIGRALLTPYLVMARQGHLFELTAISERAAAPAAAREFSFLSTSLYEKGFANCQSSV
jgi:hypothetical protein